MPCYDPRDRFLPEEFQRLTRVACDMAKFINRTVEHLSPETIAWIVEHEGLDKARSCPNCESEDKAVRRLMPDETCCEYGGPTLWDPCDDPWHNAEVPVR